MDKIIVIGGPGPAVVVSNAIMHAQSRFGADVQLHGLLNDSQVGEKINGIPVVGSLSDAHKLAKEGYQFIYTIYKMGHQPQRMELFKSLGISEDQMYTFVHPMAYVAPDVHLAPGVAVMPNASISPNTSVGMGTLVMSNAFIGHDTTIGRHCFIAATSCVGSYIKVEDGVWVGFNATIRGKQTIGSCSAIGIGSVVVSDIPEQELWIGNPARFHKKVTDKIRL